MKQAEMIHLYNEVSRPKFNQELFIRHDDDIVKAIRNVVYSTQRESSFIIRVEGFEVIDNYDDINHILWAYEDSIINKNKNTNKPDDNKKPTKASSNSKKAENQFDFINLKDSDIKIIKVTYYIGITEKKNGFVSDHVVVYITIPRIVDKFYFRISGNIYSAMYQIVDASTYNNSNAKNAKKQSITFKTIFMPIRVYKYIGKLRNVDGDDIPCTYFIGNMFKKSLLLMKYIFAKMGYYGALNFLKVPGVIISENTNNIDKENMHIFSVRDNLFVSIPKYIYENSVIAQSAVYTIVAVLTHVKDSEMKDAFGYDIYLKSLGAEFTSKDIDTIRNKGLSILGSLEFIYDIGTKEDLKLSLEDKDDIYRVLRWMMYEFSALRKKDNLDISTKKVRYAEYIAALYAAKLAFGIYRLSDKADKADLDTIRKAIQIPPMFLLSAITNAKCQLVNYKDCVNDLDSLTALKYTYKGVSGIGEKSSAISSAYRAIHPSHLGRVDIDSSSNSDPGVSGTLCPISSFHDSHFIDFMEPSTWNSDINKMIDQYKAMNSKIEVCRIVRDNKLSTKQYDSTMVEECKSVAKDLLRMPTIVENTSEYINGYDIFGDDKFFVTRD